MTTDLRKKRILDTFIHILYLVFFSSLIFSFRAVTSISITAILFSGIFLTRSAFRAVLQNTKTHHLFLAGCFWFFLFQVISLLYTNDMQQGWNNVRIKTGVIITPLVVLVSFYLNADTRKKLFSHYCVILIA